MPPNIQMITDPKKAKILASETRVKILQEIAANPQSISQLARKVGISPVAAFYHIKKLKQAGFIRIAKTAVVNNNLTEKFYEITTAAYLVAVSLDQTVKGPVPPKKQATKLLLGVSPADVEKTYSLLGLTYTPENKVQVEGNTIKLLEMAVHEAGEVHKEILNQLNLKLSAADRLKIEYAAMAVLPIVLDKIAYKPESLETLRSVVGKLQKSGK